MPERIPVYRYTIHRDGEEETRWSLAPVNPAGYAGNDAPHDAHPLGNEAAKPGDTRPAGHVEAPDGTRITSFEPPVLEVPGQGAVNLLSLLGAEGGGDTSGRSALRFIAG